MNMQNKIEKLVPQDKALHHIWGECNQVAAMLFTFWIIGLWCIPLGWVFNFICQWSKEYFIDRKKVTGFSWSDIAFGMTGCIPASIVVFVITWFK